MTPEQYTLGEARRELERRECASSHHAPATPVQTFADPVGYWLCGCGEVTWEQAHHPDVLGRVEPRGHEVTTLPGE